MKSLFCFFLIVPHLICGQINSNVVSKGNKIKKERILIAEINNSASQHDKIDALNKLSRFYIYYLPQNSPFYANKALELAKEIKYINGIADSYVNLGYSSFRIDAYKKADSFYNRAIENYTTVNNKVGIGMCYHLKARVSNGLGDYENSMNLLLKARKNFESVNHTLGMGRVYETMGDINDIFGDYSNALDKLNLSISIKEDFKDSLSISRTYAYLGNVYNHMRKTELAIENFNKALDISRATYNLNSESYTLTKLGDIYIDLKDYNYSISYYEQSLIITTKHSNHWGGVRNLLGIGKNYYYKQNCPKAVAYLNKAIKAANKISDKDGLMKSYKIKYKVYELCDSLKKAFESYKMYTLYKDSLYSRKTASNIAMLQNDYNEKIILQEKQKTELVIYFVCVLLLLVLGYLFLIFLRFRTTKKILKRELKLKNIIEQQKIEVEGQRRDLMDNIAYAKKIQDAILPSEKKRKEVLPDSFAYYRAKDLVSGDFYWVHKNANGVVYFTVADCTGHGVSGAFMSIIGQTLLNDLVVNRGVTEVNDILYKMRGQIIKYLGQKGDAGETRDGIDMALCRMDAKQKKLSFAGAFNSLYLIREDQLIEYKGTRRPVGYFIGQGLPFEKVDIEIKKGDVIYLFSDGYADQFGGSKNRKFMYGKLKKLLLSIHKKGMSEQEKILEKTIKEWMGDYEQVDDICVMGVRV